MNDPTVDGVRQALTTVLLLTEAPRSRPTSIISTMVSTC